MAVPLVPVAIGVVIAVLAAMNGSSKTNSKTTDDKTKTPFALGSMDGTNDCANGFPYNPTAGAAKSTDAAQYLAGYNAGWSGACTVPPDGPPVVTPSYTCITPSAGMTLSQAQVALSSLGYSYAEPIGTCGPGTIAAIKSFQGSNGLAVDGLIGPATAAKLKSKASAPVTTDTYTYTDSNGVVWDIVQVASTLWRGTPTNITSPIYNTHLEAMTSPQLKSAIDAFAAAAASSVGTAGRRARHGRPHTPFADRRPAFPPFVRMM